MKVEKMTTLTCIKTEKKVKILYYPTYTEGLKTIFSRMTIINTKSNNMIMLNSIKLCIKLNKTHCMHLIMHLITTVHNSFN